MTKHQPIKKTSASPTKASKSRPSIIWIIAGIVILLVLGFLLMKVFRPDKPPETKSTTSTIRSENPANDTTSHKTSAAIPSRKGITDLAEKIPGEWYVTERLFEGKPVNTSSGLSKGSWQFYEDGSLKFTSALYSDMGTWKVESGDFNVSLYGHGKYPGYISDINSKAMTWVTTEDIGGRMVTVVNHLTRRK